MLCVLIGSVGMAVDLGRSFAARGDLQSYTDNAALAASMQLDGTSAGLIRARTEVTNSTTGTYGTKWDFGTKTIPNQVTEFAKGLAATPNKPDAGTWAANPGSAADYRFVRVRSTLPVPVVFMQALNIAKGASIPNQVQVKAEAIAGQALITSFPQGLLPFSPIAQSPVPDNFGLQPGQQYTLRYPTPSGGKKMDVCAGDVGQAYVEQLPSQDRGYWGFNSAAQIRGSIIDGNQAAVINIGDPVPMVGGAKNTEGAALDDRILQDSDSTSSTYASYMSGNRGNGRRIVPVPMNDGPPNFIAVGVGAFFLKAAGGYSSVSGNDPICAEYIGPYVEGSFYGGAGATGASGNTGGYKVRLIQ
jgi:Flp pilus assembly protein TadG